jgi:S-adenosylmethionine decarboxylase
MTEEKKVLGYHLILNVSNIQDKKGLEEKDEITPLFDAIVNDMSLNVIRKVKFNFNPVGCSLLYLLSESHLSGHTFVDEGAICIDLFTCNKNCNFEPVMNLVKRYFNVENDDIQAQVLVR